MVKIVNSKNIKFDEWYRLKSSPDYGYVKPLSIHKPRTIDKNLNCITVKCLHCVNMYDDFGFKRYFKLSDLIKQKYVLLTKLRSIDAQYNGSKALYMFKDNDGFHRIRTKDNIVLYLDEENIIN